MNFRLNYLRFQCCMLLAFLCIGTAHAQVVDQNWKTPAEAQISCLQEITQADAMLGNPALTPEERGQWLAYRKLVDITNQLVQGNTPIRTALEQSHKQVIELLPVDKDLAYVHADQLDPLVERLHEQLTAQNVLPQSAH